MTAQERKVKRRTAPSALSLFERLIFHSHVVTNGCWTWAGSKDKDGYGNTKVAGKHAFAHRAMYQVCRGPIPEGMQLDHLCRNRACINPAHLDIVTSFENTMRSNAASAINARKTHCIHGHPLAGDNLSIQAAKNRSGARRFRRVCLACVRRNNEKYMERKRGIT